ncbi:MAG TPA: hypothetical protein VFZ21_30605 [Gemmatimonadaceae bacterium]|jgi:hypothetical protein|nr:hypothetical protein [Gemmatimonadaceae bacterium]
MGLFKRSAASEESASGGSMADADRRRRYEPRAVYVLAESLRKRGVDFAKRSGPWRVAARTLRRPGRNGLAFLPVVTNGMAQIMVDTMEHAVDLAGLLNWCGVNELDPVPDLVPPPTLAADGQAFA